MSLETRSTSAHFKRAEQLKRWEESDTNREPALPKQTKQRKIKFSSGCVFLAACAAGDKDEVLKLLEKGADINTANVDGLTALHQACIDDNLDMVEFLVEHGADVNRGDNEGWTPLHATASCGFLYIAKYLIDKGANIAAVNNDGELAIDIAESQKMEDLLREEIKKQGIDCDAARNEEETIMLRDAKEWLTTNSSCVNYMHPKNGATPLHVACAKGYVEVIKVLLRCGANVDAQDIDGWTPLHAAAHWAQRESCQLLAENFADMDAVNCVGQTAFDLCDIDMRPFLENLKKKQSYDEFGTRRQAKKRLEIQNNALDFESKPTKVKKVDIPTKQNENDDMKKLSEDSIEEKNRANASLINDGSNISKKDDTNPVSPTENITINANTVPQVTPTAKAISPIISSNSNEASWRKSLPKSTTEIHAKENTILNDEISEPEDGVRNTSSSKTSLDPQNVENPPLSLKAPPSPVQNSKSIQIPPRRSFVPPVRDEESETQRKAHAKRVRETRRSTQGVTLEEIKSAEQYIKMNSQNVNNNNNTSSNTNEKVQCGESNVTASDSTNGVSASATITAATSIPTVNLTQENDESTNAITHERRPSWRLRVDNGSCKFKLEDATKPNELTSTPSTPSTVRRSSNIGINQHPSSVPIETTETTITLPLRKPKNSDEKDNDKENDVRNAQGTLTAQSAIQRRKRPKRRSTGVVSFDNVDDLDQDQTAGGDFDPELKKSENINISQNSGPEKHSRSRLSSTSDIRNENGEIDYKKLYEQQLAENEKLKEKLRKSEEELRETKQTLEKINAVTSKNSLSELEKRERRAMERKLSEMEEELKQLQKLKAENERLKNDNKSLTRVITKLSPSSKK